MTPSPSTPTVSAPTTPKSRSPVWYRPTVSPEHGVYVMLLVAILIGAAAAVTWKWTTTLAAISAFCGFQAEHPLVVQIKQRRSLKPRLLVWGGLYAGLSGSIALYLYWLQGNWQSPLLWVYAGAIGAFLVDAVSVFYREQKSILNELITFFAVCLSIPFIYVATMETMSTAVLGLWLLTGLYFSSTIFTVKFRKQKQHPLTPSLVYHTIAALAVAGLWAIGWLSPFTSLAFGIALLKLAIILCLQDWYCTAPIQSIAVFETVSALLFLLLTVLSLLPPHLA